MPFGQQPPGRYGRLAALAAGASAIPAPPSNPSVASTPQDRAILTHFSLSTRDGRRHDGHEGSPGSAGRRHVTAACQATLTAG